MRLHMKIGTASAFLTMSMTLVITPAAAEVRFGNNVRIGGHDVSGQTFNSQRRGLYIIHDKKPANEGCTWRRNRDGSQTKICHVQRKR